MIRYNGIFKRLLSEGKKTKVSNINKKGSISNAPAWESEQATYSEENVKADRNDDYTIEEMKKNPLKIFKISTLNKLLFG